VRSFFNSKTRQDRRFFFGKKVDLEFDPQGRLTIPKNLRDDKDLYPTVDVVLVGCGDYVELLAKKHYQADCARWEAAGGYEKLFSDNPPLPDYPQSPDNAEGSDA
jgi:DNA-binding transcriptional regulator/RsmH inhibitor MraZ